MFVSSRIFKYLSILQLMICLVGLAAALSLFFSMLGFHAWGCAVDGGCHEVATSTRSEFLGLPLPLLGVLYWVACVTFALGTVVRKDDPSWRQALSFLSSFGAVFSLGLAWTQFLLGAWCLLCLTSGMASLLLAFTTVVPWRLCHE